MHGKKQESEKFLNQSLYPLVSQGFIEIELYPNAGSSVAWKNAGVLLHMRLGYSLWAGWSSLLTHLCLQRPGGEDVGGETVIG